MNESDVRFNELVNESLNKYLANHEAYLIQTRVEIAELVAEEPELVGMESTLMQAILFNYSTQSINYLGVLAKEEGLDVAYSLVADLMKIILNNLNNN